MKKFDFDIIVIGAGSAGLVSSKLAVGLGKKVLLIENNKIGGECSYSGCIPSKAFIKVSKAYYDAKLLKNFNIKGNVNLDPDNILVYVKNIVNKVARDHTPEIIEKDGIKIIFGNPEFVDNHKIKLNNRNYTAEKFIIATGSSAKIPNIMGMDNIKYLTNETFFEQKKLENSYIILGGGPIGIELGQSLTRIGIKTTIIQSNCRILMKDDEELSLILQKKLLNEGLNIFFKTKVNKIIKEKNNFILEIENQIKKKQKIIGNSLLIAIGRMPNVNKLYLDNAGVKYNEKGILVNDFLQSSVKNIFCCGDVINHFNFSHIAEYQARIATTNAVLPFKSKINYQNVLWTTFVDPEFSHSGLTESQAIEKYNNKIDVYRYEYKSLDRAITDNNENGIAKFIINKKGKLVGAHILGVNAGELIHEAQILKSMNLKFSKIQNVIHSYPTYSDITRQIGKKVYINELRNNLIIKIISKFRGIKK